MAQCVAADVQILQDVAYLEEGREETLDLYLPINESLARPTVVWIHGGGWSGGNKDAKREVLVSTALAEEGFVVASINYKLGTDPQNPVWPQPLLDCKNAVRFMRANASQYGIDTERIAVMGGSAGGHLALMVAFTEEVAELEPQEPYPGVSNAVAAVGNFYGVVNFLTRCEIEADGTPTSEIKSYAKGTLLPKSIKEDMSLWRSISPVNYVRENVPPVFNTHGKKDTTVDYLQAVELDEALQKCGVIHETVLLENAGHTYALSSWKDEPLERDLRPLVVDFLHRAFAQKKS